MSAWMTALKESSKEAIFEECLRQRERADYFEEEAFEQARLLGISGSREAQLLTRIERLERALEKIASCTSNFPGDVVDIARKVIEENKEK
jgi:hypothetical protein